MHYFKTKQEYQKFLVGWRKVVQSPYVKSKMIQTNECRIDDKGELVVSVGTGLWKEPGWIRPHHHILYNILRDRHPARGFTKRTNKHKLKNTFSNCESFRFQASLDILKNHCIVAKHVMDNPGERYKYVQQTIGIRVFVKPFNGGVGIVHLAQIDIDEVMAKYN